MHRAQYFWECVTLARRLVIAGVALAKELVTKQTARFTYLVSQPFLLAHAECVCVCVCVCVSSLLCCQCGVCSQGMTSVLFLIIQVYYAPYGMRIDNTAELLAQATLLLLCIFLESAEQPIQPGLAAGLSSMCLIVGLLFALRIVLDRYETLARSIGLISKRSRASASARASSSSVKSPIEREHKSNASMEMDAVAAAAGASAPHKSQASLELDAAAAAEAAAAPERATSPKSQASSIEMDMEPAPPSADALGTDAPPPPPPPPPTELEAGDIDAKAASAV
jgi:hypothetical protein